MFTCIIAVAVGPILASKHKRHNPNARNRYLSIAILMPVIVVGLLAFGGNYHVLAAEFAAIFLFAVFWAFQTEGGERALHGKASSSSATRGLWRDKKLCR